MHCGYRPSIRASLRQTEFQIGNGEFYVHDKVRIKVGNPAGQGTNAKVGIRGRAFFMGGLSYGCVGYEVLVKSDPNFANAETE